MTMCKACSDEHTQNYLSAVSHILQSSRLIHNFTVLVQPRCSQDKLLFSTETDKTTPRNMSSTKRKQWLSEHSPTFSSE